MKVLYLSVLASHDVIKEIDKRFPNYSGFAVQKFSRLLAEGMASNSVEVVALSSFFLPSVGRLWHHHSEEENGLSYKYIPSINLGPLRHVWLIIYCFTYVLLWSLKNKKNKALMCDVMNVSSCIGAIAAARLIGMRRVGVVTDLPGMIPGRSIKECLESKQMRICMKYLPHFTHYVFLTQQMNEVVNLNHRPYMILEGLVDSGLLIDEEVRKEEKRIAIYAGGLREEYGLKLLVEGFEKADVKNSELWIYGNGPFAEKLRIYEQNNERVKYFGIRPNEEIVNTELRATLLVNPRPSKEELTQYSFPSKNMEYMVSGTPVLTTILPGMPKEYHQHVYLFDQGETVEGYASVIKKVLSLPEEELMQKGSEARQWVLENKNNIKQAERVISFIIN